MKTQLVNLARSVTGNIVFSKSLPAEFRREKIYVTSRADIRLLAPGLARSAGDLFVVVGKYVRENDVVWDIGSNLGILTFCSAVKVGKGGGVYSLEADPRYADLQTRTLKRFTKNAGCVTILCAAVADRLGVLGLVVPKKGHARNHLSVVRGNSAGEAEIIKQVVTITLDWLLDYWQPPDFIKIDVEGAEVLALRGASRLFSEYRPLGYVECSAENASALTKFFHDRRYALFSLGENGEETPIETFAFNTVVKPRESCFRR